MLTVNCMRWNLCGELVDKPLQNSVVDRFSVALIMTNLYIMQNVFRTGFWGFAHDRVQICISLQESFFLTDGNMKILFVALLNTEKGPTRNPISYACTHSWVSYRRPWIKFYAIITGGDTKRWRVAQFWGAHRTSEWQTMRLASSAKSFVLLSYFQNSRKISISHCTMSYYATHATSCV
jgi:hypothetical protein